MKTFKNIKVTGDSIATDIPNFEFSWDYIAKSGPQSSTYLKLESAKFVKEDNTTIERDFQPNERKRSGLVLARLAIQVFEKELDSLTETDRRNLITDATGNKIGLWNNKDELSHEWGNSNNSGKKPSKDYVADMYIGNAYPSTANAKFYFYNAGLFDSLWLAQNFIKQFGSKGDAFIISVTQNEDSQSVVSDNSSYISSDDFFIDKVNKLESSKNIIFTGSPGTGKTYLAKEVASYIVSNGRTRNTFELNDFEKTCIEFVQFHPSYDYIDFVEGLRPYYKDNDMTFQLEDGIFKQFCEKACQSLHQVPTLDGLKKHLLELGKNEHDNYFYIFEQLLGLKSYTGKKMEVFPRYNSLEEIYDNIDELKKLDKKYDFGQFLITPMNYLKKYFDQLNTEKLSTQKFIFIIDEINRGEISKIFGELFFSIDPGYRGIKGSVKTQYSNLHKENAPLFYVPENVYIIGTMNDIDRSVDTFDFAMRRRFRFIKISAAESTSILENAVSDDGNPLLSDTIIEDATRKMELINTLISSDAFPDLNSNYHIGASYFLKLNELNGSFPDLWNDYLEPLFREYLRGTYNEDEQIEMIRKSYFEIDSEALNYDIQR